jgi:hypothetical protein
MTCVWMTYSIAEIRNQSIKRCLNSNCQTFNISMKFLLLLAPFSFLMSCGQTEEMRPEDKIEPTLTLKPAPAGFFAFSGPNTSVTTKKELLNLDYVDGITIYTTWASIEPEENQFTFSYIDEIIALAQAKNKKVTLGIFTGKNSIPQWAFDKGIQSYINAKKDQLVHPSDALFLEMWTKRVQKLGERYDKDTTVIQIAICGAAGTLCGPRYPELPPNITFDELTNHWDKIIDAYRDAFPLTYKHLEIHLTDRYATQLPEALFTKIDTKENIGPFAEFLSPTTPSTEVATGITFINLSKTYAWSAFQMVSPQQEKIGEAIMHGKSFGTKYFEIYENDLLNYGSLISPLR